MAKYTGKQLIDDVMKEVDAKSLFQPKKSMILRPQMIGSYYKNRKQIRNIAYWMNVLNNNDVEALEKLQA